MAGRIIAPILLILLSPLFLLLLLIVRTTSKGPFLYPQLRVGKNKKPFVMYKIRTMVQGAEHEQYRYQHLNEADGPVFKIRNDPRFTAFGKWLARKGFDELPQLINIVKGDMAFVGPRPLPINEAAKIPKKYQARFSVLPGMTSMWVVKGTHQLSFKEWMELDIGYVQKKSLFFDIWVMVLTLKTLLTHPPQEPKNHHDNRRFEENEYPTPQRDRRQLKQRPKAPYTKFSNRVSAKNIRVLRKPNSLGTPPGESF